jgi:hypothetical protein
MEHDLQIEVLKSLYKERFRKTVSKMTKSQLHEASGEWLQKQICHLNMRKNEEYVDQHDRQTAIDMTQLYGALHDLSSGTETNHVLITINPDNSKVVINDFKELVEQSINKKWILGEVYYTFEQRGENLEEMGKGFHAHILMNRNGKRPSEIHREYFNTFKHVCGNKKHVDVRINKNFSETFDYISGKKFKDEKQKKQDIDVLWRQKIGLQTHYKIEK